MKIGLFGATSIGVGAIVGGGIMALAGTAFSVAGPAAIIAFLLNALIAFITAFSFAELSTVFPESGGTYTFSKKAFSVGAAFGVGWIVWFASIVAAALYALGFASFFVSSVNELTTTPIGLLNGAWSLSIVSIILCLGAAAYLIKTNSSGGDLINVLKLVVFAIIIFGGAFVYFFIHNPEVEPGSVARNHFKPFLPFGFGGILSAMGFTFIALQGFDLIAAVAGEIENPRRNIPRSMFYSLGIAVMIYIPMLVVMILVGLPQNKSLIEFTAENPDTVIARSVHLFLGGFGFWLVMIAGLLSMASAMMANLFAASRIAHSMSRDRTLPLFVDRVNKVTGSPDIAILITSIVACLILLTIRDVGTAGAVSSLIFLISFTFAHSMCLIIRRRKKNHNGFKTPFYPHLPRIGLVLCLGLALYQGVVVPMAGVLTLIWLVLGFFCYLWLFHKRAKIVDAVNETTDPDLLELRGRSPLVLLPIGNPKNAYNLTTFAACLTPARVGRVLLLNIIKKSKQEDLRAHLNDMTQILSTSLEAAVGAQVEVETMVVISDNHWHEIVKVAHIHRCSMVLMGLTKIMSEDHKSQLERTFARISCHIGLLRLSHGWQLKDMKRILVPIGGNTVHNALRARFINSIVQFINPHIIVNYLLILSENTSIEKQNQTRKVWQNLVSDETPHPFELTILLGNDVSKKLTESVEEKDLVLLGLNNNSKKKRVFGKIITSMIEDTDAPILIIGQGV